ncbi:cell division cycle 48C [Tanacetum coccineum]
MDDQSQQQECGSSCVGLVYDERMCKHSAPAETEHHENPERIRAIWNKLVSAGIPQRVAKPDDTKKTGTTDCKPGYVLVIGATNRPDVVDPALKRPELTSKNNSLTSVSVDSHANSIHTRDFEPTESFVYESLRVGRTSDLDCGTELPVTSMLDSPDLSEARFSWFSSIGEKAGNLAMKGIIDGRKSELSKENSETEENEDWWRKAWTPEEMEKLSITLSDFEVAAKLVQPSSRREGFSSILNVKP